MWREAGEESWESSLKGKSPETRSVNMMRSTMSRRFTFKSFYTFILFGNGWVVGIGGVVGCFAETCISILHRQTINKSYWLYMQEQPLEHVMDGVSEWSD